MFCFQKFHPFCHYLLLIALNHIRLRLLYRQEFYLKNMMISRQMYTKITQTKLRLLNDTSSKLPYFLILQLPVFVSSLLAFSSLSRNIRMRPSGASCRSLLVNMSSVLSGINAFINEPLQKIEVRQLSKILATLNFFT